MDRYNTSHLTKGKAPAIAWRNQDETKRKTLKFQRLK